MGTLADTPNLIIHFYREKFWTKKWIAGMELYKI